MAYQQAIVRRTPSLVPDYEANLRARIPTLADQLALTEQKREAEAQRAYQNRQLSLQEKQLKQEQKEGKAGLATQALGLAAQASLPSILNRSSATKAATNVATNAGSNLYSSSRNLGPVSTAPTQGGLFSFTNKIGDYGKQFTSGLTGMNTIGAGSLGFGIGTVVPTKNKLLKTAAGAAGGALMDLFTGGGNSTGTSALFGGLGGLLGGLF